jgi:hypothetical protein
MEHVTCPECGFEQRLVLGDYSINRQGEGVAIYHVGLHGAAIVGSGDDLPEALREVADSVEDPPYES